VKVLCLSVLVPLFLIFLSQKSRAISFDAVRRNNEGISQLNKENAYLGYKKLVHALEKDPFNPVIHLNLGLAFLINKESSKAVKAFSTAARLSEGNDEFQFYSLFNGGVAAAQAGDIDMALKFYQAALGLRPDSREVKTNIELLWKGQSGQGQGQDKSSKDDQSNQKKNPKGQEQRKEDASYDQKRQPQPFKSKELSKEDMKKILEEIKDQEQKIRAQENKQGQKEAPNGKDW